MRTLHQLKQDLIIENDILVLKDPDEYKPPRIVLPDSLLDRLLEAIHSNFPMAHEGYDKCLARIAPIYYWPSMKKDLRLFIETCSKCDQFRHSRTFKSPLGRIPIAERDDLMAMDIFGGRDTVPETENGNKYVLTIIDLFTRYAVAVCIPDQSAATVVEAVTNRWLLIYGPPRKILTDQGTNFESIQFHNMCNTWRISKVRTTTYHPPGNGLCERLN